MKNTIKISIMSGLVTAGVLLCGLPHAMAESVPQNNETYYSVNVPSEISLSPDQDETTFTVSGNTYQKRWLDIDITSKNNFNLKNGQASIPYKLDKTKFEYEPQYVDKDSISFSENIKVSKNENDVKYSGKYQDQLQFTMNPVETRTIQLDCNGGTVNGKDKVAYTVKNGSSYGQLPVPVRSGYQFSSWIDEDGNTIYSGSTVKPNTEKLSVVWLPMRVFSFSAFINGNQNEYLQNIGTFDLYENGKLIGINCYSTWQAGKAGDVYECKNFKIKPIFKYKGIWGQSLPKGVTINVDEDGNLTSIKAVLQMDANSDFSLDFEVLSPLQVLINSTKTTSIILDADKPNNVQNVSTIEDMFTTSAGVYVKNNELHLYNTKGGRLIAKQDSSHLFEYTYIDKIDANNLDVSNVTNGSYMFYGCANSTEIDVSQWDTSNIINFDKMFSNCKAVSSLEINDWNMISGYSLSDMFAYSGITDIDLSKWNSENINNLSNLFFSCTKLKQIDLHTWDTSSVSTCHWLFRDCSSLEFINIEGWDTSHVNNMDRMFGECPKLTTIKGLNKLNTSNVQAMQVMFISDTSLKSLDLSSFDTRNCIDTRQMFRGCYNLKSIYVSDTFVMTKVSNSTQMFLDCISLIGGAGTTFVPSFMDGTAARIDGGVSNPGYFTAVSQKPIEIGSVINIEGSDYIVIGQKNDDDYLVIAKTNVENIQFNHTTREDGLNASTYEDSDIDKYLENTWYNTLSTKVKQAIKETQIKQVSYSSPDTLESKQDIGPNGQTYNTISRHVFLSSVEEFSKVVDIKDEGKMKAFLDGKTLWTRDSYITPRGGAEILYANSGHLYYDIVVNSYNVRPSFVIDLSKVDYTVTGTVNYK